MSRFFSYACIGFLSCMALAACGPTEEEEEIIQQHDASMPDLKVSQVPYRCGDTNVIFKSDNINTDAGALVVANATYEMRRTASASGVRYDNMGDENTLFWTMGDKALLKINGQAYPECVEDKTGEVKIYDTPDGIRNVVWVLEDMNKKGLIDRAHITLEVRLDGNVVGNSGCNTYRGPYAMEDGNAFALTGRLMGTRRACASPAMQQQENSYLDTLQQVNKAQLDEKTGALLLTSSKGHSLRFMPE